MICVFIRCGVETKYDFDEEFLDEWNEILQDNDLFDMIVDNLSLSQLENSFLEIEPDCNNVEETEVLQLF